MATMPLVAGVDSSTQSCKIVIRDAESGALLRRGSAPHPEGTEVDPEAWWSALQEAIDMAGGIDDVAAISVAAQQHGMVCLDAAGGVARQRRGGDRSPLHRPFRRIGHRILVTRNRQILA